MVRSIRLPLSVLGMQCLPGQMGKCEQCATDRADQGQNDDGNVLQGLPTPGGRFWGQPAHASRFRVQSRAAVRAAGTTPARERPRIDCSDASDRMTAEGR